jgi:hypothetical protein
MAKVLPLLLALGLAAALGEGPTQVSTAEELQAAASSSGSIDVVSDIVLSTSIKINGGNNVTLYSSNGGSISGNHTVLVIQVSSATLFISNITIKDGNTTSNGGGIQCWPCNLTAVDVKFTHNAAGQGGALWCDNASGNTGPCRVQGGIFTHNSATVAGGAVRVYNGRTEFVDSHFGDNHAVSGDSNTIKTSSSSSVSTTCSGPSSPLDDRPSSLNCDHVDYSVCEPYVGCNVCDTCCHPWLKAQSICDGCVENECTSKSNHDCCVSFECVSGRCQRAFRAEGKYPSFVACKAACGGL